MDTTKAHQKALDDALVAPKNCLKIGKCNQRLSPTLKSNEPTIQVALDALKLTPFYNAFEVSADVLKIYMQEFWATITKHHFSLRFKMNGKSHTVNVDNFRDMLNIFPKLPGQKFKDPSFKEEILSFIRDLGHTGEIKCLSGKTTTLESLRLSRAQILWGMYHNKNVNYVYLLWEDLVYQVENKNSKKNNDMYYPRFTKVIVDYFMAKDQVYSAILPQHLTNQSMLESESYKTYVDYATGKRLKTLAKVAKPAKKKQLAKTSKAKDEEVSLVDGVLEGALGALVSRDLEMEASSGGHEEWSTCTRSSTSSSSSIMLMRMRAVDDKKMRMRRNAHLILMYECVSDGYSMCSHVVMMEMIDELSSDEEDDDEVGLNDNNGDNDDDEDNDDDDDQEDDGQDDEDQDDVNEQTDSDNDGDDFVHPKHSTQDQEVRHNEDESNKESDEEIQGTNVEEEELDEEETNDEDKANELYRDVNVNLEGRDIEMTDAQQTNVQTTQVIEDTHVIITPVNPEGQQQSSSVSSGFVSNMLNSSPDTCIDSIFNLNTESTSLIDVPVTTIAEPPLLSTTTLPPPHTPLITHLQQTPVPTPATILSSSLQDLPNFGSLFGLRDEAQAENEDFLNKLNDNIKKIIKDQVKEQVKAQTYHAVAANLSELELKKILIDKMESNKSIYRSDEQKNLYKALVDAYESDKLILDTYEDNVSFKRCRDDEDKDEEPPAGSNWGSKRIRAGKEPESTSAPKEKTSKITSKSIEGSKSHHKSAGESAQAEEPRHTAKDLEEPAHLEFETRVTEDQPDEETSQLPDWFQKPAKPPTPDRDWNKTFPDAHGPVQPWLKSLA
ncbi:hypothetical protein Tco_0577981 [Tanacetum coccineum]